MRSLRINGFKTDAPVTQCIFDELSVKVLSDTSLGASGEILSNFHGYDGYSCLCLFQYTQNTSNVLADLISP